MFIFQLGEEAIFLHIPADRVCLRHCHSLRSRLSELAGLPVRGRLYSSGHPRHAVRSRWVSQLVDMIIFRWHLFAWYCCTEMLYNFWKFTHKNFIYVLNQKLTSYLYLTLKHYVDVFGRSLSEVMKWVDVFP